MSEENLFEKLGLKVDSAVPEVGETYPLYGIITNIISESDGALEVVLNFNIKLKLNVKDAEQRNIIRERAFEPGIFVTNILKKYEDGEDFSFAGDCTTVVFGKKQHNYA